LAERAGIDCRGLFIDFDKSVSKRTFPKEHFQKIISKRAFPKDHFQKIISKRADAISIPYK
jgi:hypothetical protein